MCWSIPGATHEHYRPHKWLAQIRTQGHRKNLPIFLVIAETSLLFFFFDKEKTSLQDPTNSKYTISFTSGHWQKH